MLSIWAHWFYVTYSFMKIKIVTINTTKIINYFYNQRHDNKVLWIESSKIHISYILIFHICGPLTSLFRNVTKKHTPPPAVP